MSNVVQEVTDLNFEQVVLKSKKTVIVDFWAPWCGPCRMMSPVFEEIAATMPDLLFCKINVDESHATSSKLRVTGIPFFVIFKNGKPVVTKTGGSSSLEMQEWIQSNA